MSAREHRRLDLALRLLTCAAVLALGAFGLARPDTILLPGCAWLAFLLFVLHGWGTVVAKFARVEDADAGLRMVWGAVAYMIVAGGLMAIGACSRPAILAMIAIGAAAACGRELLTERPLWRGVVDATRYARREPGTAAIVGFFVGIVVVHVVGAAARLEMNAYDDDVGYTALVKRLLDIGDIDEPFSFRRLSAFGGQTALQALGGARGTLMNAHLIDRGVFQVIAILLVVGLARRRQLPAYWTALTVLVLLMIPEMSINIASHWSGLALFLGMYRTSLELREDRSVVPIGLLAATAAMTCTLRQNFLPIAALYLVLILAFRLHTAARARSWGAAWREERRPWLVASVVGTACALPYLFASWTSNRTFLYPFMPGTFNPNLSLRPEVFSLAQEVKFFTWVFLESEPIRVLPLLLPIVLITKDLRAGKPLTAWLVANVVGLVILVHGFTLSDPGNLWRYAFGPVVGLTVAYLIEIGAQGLRDEPDVPVRTPVFARVLLLLVVFVQIGLVRNNVPRNYREIASDVGEARTRDRHPGAYTRQIEAHYAALQAAMPEGAWVASMVDEPYYLDYAKQNVINLDVPGYASWSPGWPTFSGAEAVRAYFLGHGIRYLAYVRGDLSRYLYRRTFWVKRIFVDAAEIWQTMGAYIVDALDTFDELARTSTVLYDRDGTVLLDLGASRGAVSPPAAPEAQRREEFLRRLSEQEHLPEAWSLLSRHDFRYEEGFSPIAYENPDDHSFEFYEACTGCRPMKGQPVRWVGRRAHLRVRGDVPMKLQLDGRVAVKTIFTRPRVEVMVGGLVLGSWVVGEDGRFHVDATVPSTALDGWTDAYITFSSVAEPWREPGDLRAAALERVRWHPAGEPSSQ